MDFMTDLITEIPSPSTFMGMQWVLDITNFNAFVEGRTSTPTEILERKTYPVLNTHLICISL